MLRRVRHFLREYTATAVKEHIRSEIEDTSGSPELTKREIELVRYIRKEPLDWDAYLAGRSAD
ncbi:MAG TPA: hypothetical protein VLU96_02955 [Gaiellaceae bacterium]|nr:hypothetical protein [Gaiellaceae bacterium]